MLIVAFFRFIFEHSSMFIIIKILLLTVGGVLLDLLKSGDSPTGVPTSHSDGGNSSTWVSPSQVCQVNNQDSPTHLYKTQIQHY